MQRSQVTTLLTVLVLIIIVIFLYSNKSTSIVLIPSPTPIETVSATTPTVSSSGMSMTIASSSLQYVVPLTANAHVAVFQFLQPMRVEDITMANIKPCIGEADTIAAHGTIPCQPGNKYTVSYDISTNKVTVAEPGDNTQNTNTIGIFNTECKTCQHLVNFNGLHTANGALLPNKSIIIR